MIVKTDGSFAALVASLYKMRRVTVVTPEPVLCPAALAAAGSHLISVASHRSLACTRSRVRATGGRAFVTL